MKIKVKIVTQGGPVVNDGWIVASGPDIAAVDIDLSSKYCVVEATSGSHDGLAPMVYIGADKNSLHLKKGREAKTTEIALPQYKGWQIWMSELSRYTLSICLIKPKE
jgi:hypothetical protein